MIKKTVITILFLIIFLVLNAQMISARQKFLRINLGGGASLIFGDDVINREEENHAYDAQLTFATGLSYVSDNPNRIVNFEPGIRYVVRGFDEVYDKDTEKPRYEGTSISYIDIFGKLKLGQDQLYLVLGSGVAIAPFTEFYNTFNIPIFWGCDFYIRPKLILGIEGDILLLDMPVKDAYQNFNKVKGFTALFSISFLI